jgi:hypothetical protein
MSVARAESAFSYETNRLYVTDNAAGNVVMLIALGHRHRYHMHAPENALRYMHRVIMTMLQELVQTIPYGAATER